jgi:hypothetical protein
MIRMLKGRLHMRQYHDHINHDLVNKEWESVTVPVQAKTKKL